MQEKYGDFLIQMLTADDNAIDFYTKMGYTEAERTGPCGSNWELK